jgi:hypothetical protein
MPPATLKPCLAFCHLKTAQHDHKAAICPTSHPPHFRLSHLTHPPTPTHQPSLPNRRCYEVRCNPTSIIDGYGETFDRSSACKTDGTVVVRTVDNCESPPTSVHHKNPTQPPSHPHVHRRTNVLPSTPPTKLPAPCLLRCICPRIPGHPSTLMHPMCVPQSAHSPLPIAPPPHTRHAGPCNYPDNFYSNKRW